jgi:rfaE bifunctional protein nucleotidyltransferase chain/domain
VPNIHESQLQHVCALREEWKRSGKSVVFTNGCFDIVHAGHVDYLEWARSQGDVLILGLNDDASVKGLKGPSRPIVPFEQRKRILGALRAVIGFSEQTPEYLIELLHPDIHVKSAQYRLEDLPERAIVEAGGGKVVLAPHIAGLSTTDIVARIREAV